MNKRELWASRRPKNARAYDDRLILKGVKPASRKQLQRARAQVRRHKHRRKR